MKDRFIDLQRKKEDEEMIKYLKAIEGVNTKEFKIFLRGNPYMKPSAAYKEFHVWLAANDLTSEEEVWQRELSISGTKPYIYLELHMTIKDKDGHVVRKAVEVAEVLGGFSNPIKKAMTNARRRVLMALGFGLDFAEEDEDDEEVVALKAEEKSNVINLNALEKSNVINLNAEGKSNVNPALSKTKAATDKQILHYHKMAGALAKRLGQKKEVIVSYTLSEAKKGAIEHLSMHEISDYIDRITKKLEQTKSPKEKEEEKREEKVEEKREEKAKDIVETLLALERE